jgi:hypothetical protein
MYPTYTPRPIRFAGLERARGHTLKRYHIQYGVAPWRETDFNAGWHAALHALPPADPPVGRPGLGFVILHQGCGADYIVLAWWDRQNELPIRVFVRDNQAWRPAQGGEGVCVWDLNVIAWERNAYVQTVLSNADLEAMTRLYLQRTIEGDL